MWDEYKKVNDSIHVPEELVNRTVKAAEREERRRKIIGLWKYTAIAACFCFVCLGIWGAAFKDKIVIQDVTFASSEMEIGLNLGKKDISETREWEDIQVEKYTEKDDENIPKELWKLKPGRVHGEKVYIGKTEDGILHAVFEKDGKIWYVTEEKGDKENLTEYLKIPVSTTHTITGAIIGVGATKRLSAVRWGITRSLMTAWVLTIPVSGILAAVIYGVVTLF